MNWIVFETNCFEPLYNKWCPHHQKYYIWNWIAKETAGFLKSFHLNQKEESYIQFVRWSYGKNYSREVVGRVFEKFESFIEMSGKRKKTIRFSTLKKWTRTSFELRLKQTSSKQRQSKIPETFFFHYYWRNLSSVPHEETLTNEVTLNATKTNIFQENLENQK